MRQTHRFDKSFGPIASFSGILIFIAGLFATYFALTVLILVVLGAFIGFTDSSTIIDTKTIESDFQIISLGYLKLGNGLISTKRCKSE